MKIKWNFDYSLTFPALRNVIEISSGKFGWVSVLKRCHQNPVFLLLGFTFIWVGFILRKVCLLMSRPPSPQPPRPAPTSHLTRGVTLTEREDLFLMLQWKSQGTLSLAQLGSYVPPLLSALRVLSSAYLRLLIFLPKILISACASSSPALAWCPLI